MAALSRFHIIFRRCYSHAPGQEFNNYRAVDRTATPCCNEIHICSLFSAVNVLTQAETCDYIEMFLEAAGKNASVLIIPHSF